MSNGLGQSLIIQTKSKISLENGSIIVESDNGISKYNLVNISTLFISSRPTVSLSTTLIKELSDRDINLILLDEKFNPYVITLPFNGTFNSNKTLLEQINWPTKRKTNLFHKILKNKIDIEEAVLINNGIIKTRLFMNYKKNIQINDRTNVEGLVAKLYLSKLFGTDFNRREDNYINASLNYGYALIASYITKQIVHHGYRPELGIHHHSKTNLYNLTYDFIEPFRSIVDEYVYNNISSKFDFEDKIKMHKIFEKEIFVGAKSYELKDGIDEYILTCINYLNGKSNYKKVRYAY